jgi:hypothetical protein
MGKTRVLKSNGFWLFTHNVFQNQKKFVDTIDNGDLSFVQCKELADRKWPLMSLGTRREWHKKADMLSKTDEFKKMKREYDRLKIPKKGAYHCPLQTYFTRNPAISDFISEFYFE